MLVSLKKLIGLAVFTQSGESLGKIFDINLEAENHVVREYVVHASIFNSRVFLIKPIQVMEIMDKKMVVEDAIIKDITVFNNISSLNNESV